MFEVVMAEVDLRLAGHAQGSSVRMGVRLKGTLRVAPKRSVRVPHHEACA